MNATVDIPGDEFEAVIRFTGAATEGEAIVATVADCERRRS